MIIDELTEKERVVMAKLIDFQRATVERVDYLSAINRTVCLLLMRLDLAKPLSQRELLPKPLNSATRNTTIFARWFMFVPIKALRVRTLRNSIFLTMESTVIAVTDCQCSFTPLRNATRK